MSLELIIGPMFSGKTTEMKTRVELSALALQPCCVIKHSIDVRYSVEHEIVTHSGYRITSKESSDDNASIDIITTMKLKDIANDPTITNSKVIGIDEGQFFDDIVDMVTIWLSEGKKIIVSALDADFRARPFGKIPELIAIADKVEKKNGICMICRSAPSLFSKLLTPAPIGNVIVGGTNIFKSACRKCFY